MDAGGLYKCLHSIESRIDSEAAPSTAPKHNHCTLLSRTFQFLFLFATVLVSYQALHSESYRPNPWYTNKCLEELSPRLRHFLWPHCWSVARLKGGPDNKPPVLHLSDPTRDWGSTCSPNPSYSFPNSSRFRRYKATLSFTFWYSSEGMLSVIGASNRYHLYAFFTP